VLYIWLIVLSLIVGMSGARTVALRGHSTQGQWLLYNTGDKDELFFRNMKFLREVCQGYLGLLLVPIL